MVEAASTPAEASWDAALSAARRGDLSSARAICGALASGPAPFPGAHDFLLGRCLAEAGADLPEALDLLSRAIAANDRNVLAPHVLALALMRSDRDSEAAAILKRKSLPHDLSLLAQTALTMEARLRPLPAALPEGWPPWPPQLGPDPAALPVSAPDPRPGEPAEKEKKLRGSQKRELAAILDRMERRYAESDLLTLVKESGAALGYGLENADLHLVSGIACEEAGDAVRARVHLATALVLEPGLMLARTILGRVYWRSGWNGPAMDLWRSLPVEGPDDYGRHYHLALGHEAEGRRPEALAAMAVALKDFYIETREFFVDRVYLRWLRLAEQAAAAAVK